VTEMVRIASGADLRLTNDSAPRAVVCVNGGQGREVAGTWSATLEYLVRALAPGLPGLAFAEVRYRIKSWKALDLCIEDCEAAIGFVDRPALLLGFSMGGAVAIASAGDPRVPGVIGLSPWIPGRLDLSPLRGKRLDVIHGSLDRWLPGIPGVSPSVSRHGFERARELGAEGTYTLVRGGVHGLALRSPRGLVPLPRAREVARLAEAQLALFSSGD
jgi:pimeloyl-ACP methyl ester carboxylesterase